jgi:hypothetical protein
MISVGRQYFTICQPLPPLSSTRGKNPGLQSKCAQGLLATDKHRSPRAWGSIGLKRLSKCTYFCPSFLFFSFLLWLDLLATTPISWVAIVHASTSSRCHLVRGEAPHRSSVVPLTVVGPNKTRVFGFCSFD